MSQLVENLSLQLTEVDMLSSMFPNEGEFQVDDPAIIPTLTQCIDGAVDIKHIHSRIGFTLKLKIGESKNLLEVVTHFPHEYPRITPELFLRSSLLSKSAHKVLTDHLHKYINNEVERGELCMCYIIEWLQDNTEKYIKASFEELGYKQQKKGSSSKKESKFSRMWIYSHHIYSKIKRKDILELASDLNLTGFCMPGKPGIIAIEGFNSSVEDFWGRVRRWQWKRLVMKEKEDFEMGSKDATTFRIFEGFEEKYFEPRQTKGRAAHGDRGLLYQFLEQKGCAHVFQYYFGIEGKPTDHDSDG